MRFHPHPFIREGTETLPYNTASSEFCCAKPTFPSSKHDYIVFLQTTLPSRFACHLPLHREGFSTICIKKREKPFGFSPKLLSSFQILKSDKLSNLHILNTLNDNNVCNLVFVCSYEYIVSSELSIISISICVRCIADCYVNCSLCIKSFIVLEA